MDVMVANFLHKNALAEGLSECPSLDALIHQAYFVPLDYHPPNRHIIGGPLLDAGFETVRSKQQTQLENDKATFGLCLYGVSVVFCAMSLI